MSNRTSLLLKPSGCHSKNMVYGSTRSTKEVSTKCAPKMAPKKAKMGCHQKCSSGWVESVHLVLGSWRFMCRARWSDRAKHLSQTLHLKGLAPVCFRIWRVSSSDLAKRHWQLWKWHLYGFSPVKEIFKKRHNLHFFFFGSFVFLSHFTVMKKLMAVKHQLPVWILWWAFKCELFVYAFLQPAKNKR